MSAIAKSVFDNINFAVPVAYLFSLPVISQSWDTHAPLLSDTPQLTGVPQQTTRTSLATSLICRSASVRQISSGDCKHSIVNFTPSRFAPCLKNRTVNFKHAQSSGEGSRYTRPSCVIAAGFWVSMLNQIGEIFPLLACNQQFGEVRGHCRSWYHSQTVRTFSAVGMNALQIQNLAESILDRQAVVPAPDSEPSWYAATAPQSSPTKYEPNPTAVASWAMSATLRISKPLAGCESPRPHQIGTMTV